MPPSVHLWAMVLAMVILVECTYRIAGKVGPFEHYSRSAISLAAQRVSEKFTHTEVAQARGPQQPRIRDGNVAFTKLVKPVAPEVSVEKLYVAPEFGNPFIEKLQGVYIPHPFTGYVGLQSAFPYRKDYFGYRNNEDMYFGRYDPKTRPEVLITWSGNSEAAGLTHETTVPEFLERILNERDPSHRYKTLNLATNGYAINDEIAAYVAVAYALKPEFSITHSGVTDLSYGGTLPGGFKQTGLIYTFDAYYRWVDLMYDVQIVDNVHPNARTLNPSHMDDLIPGVLKSLDRFRSIVQGNGGELIHGLPPFNQAGAGAGAYAAIWLPDKLKELHNALPPGSFIDFTTGRKGIVFHDTIHTETETAKMYAGVYADEILRRMKTRKLDPVRKGAELQPQ
jgi:hypothetical protein